LVRSKRDSRGETGIQDRKRLRRGKAAGKKAGKTRNASGSQKRNNVHPVVSRIKGNLGPIGSGGGGRGWDRKGANLGNK